jgi:hypothetical protein
VADDVTLVFDGGCDAMGYEVAVYGGGGPDFDVHVELFEFFDTLFDYPGDFTCRNTLPAAIEGTGIPGTAKDFLALPGNEVSYLYVPIQTRLAELFWVYLSVSTDEAGWVIAGFPEIGSEAIWDCFGGNSGDYCEICFNFNSNPANPQAAMWAQVYCRDPESATPCEKAPATIAVDLISFNAKGQEIDRVADVILRLATGDDGDPSSILYHSDLRTPVVFVDVPLEKSNYANVIVLQADSGGTLAIVPAGQ